MKLTKKRIFVLALTVLVLAGVGVYAATNYGSESDPLITKSYLDKVVQPQLEQELDAALDGAQGELHSSAPGEFTELTLSAGQKVLCGAGGELLLRSGSAKTVGQLSDTTAGSAVSGGSTVTANHLYLAAEADSGFAASGSAVVLVSGSYTLN